MIEIKLRQYGNDATLPSLAHEGDAGYDLYSSEHVVIPPGETVLVNTGWEIGLPWGYVGLVCPRSGLAVREGITVLNAPGIIDAGYRGMLSVVLHNTSREEYTVKVGDRIAQLIIQPVFMTTIKEVKELNHDSARGTKGFGSSGR